MTVMQLAQILTGLGVQVGGLAIVWRMLRRFKRGEATPFGLRRRKPAAPLWWASPGPRVLRALLGRLDYGYIRRLEEGARFSSLVETEDGAEWKIPVERRPEVQAALARYRAGQSHAWEGAVETLEEAEDWAAEQRREDAEVASGLPELRTHSAGGYSETIKAKHIESEWIGPQPPRTVWGHRRIEGIDDWIIVTGMWPEGTVLCCPHGVDQDRPCGDCLEDWDDRLAKVWGRSAMRPFRTAAMRMTFATPLSLSSTRRTFSSSTPCSHAMVPPVAVEMCRHGRRMQDHCRDCRRDGWDEDRQMDVEYR